VVRCPQIKEQQYTRETLVTTSDLLKWNPEYYTIWNHRRLIIHHLLSQPEVQLSPRDSSDTFLDYNGMIDVISNDLDFLVPLLRKFPKCYWIWNYRLWLLQESTKRLPLRHARQFWEQELVLVGKMLTLDNRNFHGWGYRRTIVAALESSQLQVGEYPTRMTEQEFEYTTKMINANLSNFSAWHNRSKLIPKLLNERNADGTARRKFLDEGERLFVCD